MSNQVDVDTEALNREVDGVLGGIGPEPAPGPSAEDQARAQAEAQLQAEYEQAERAAMSYLPGCAAAVAGVSAVIMPNWQLSSAEQDQLAKACATALGWWFPNLAIHPRWMALVGIGGVMYGIAGARRDPQTGKIRPMRKKPEPAQQEGAQQDETAAA